MGPLTKLLQLAIYVVTPERLDDQAGADDQPARRPLLGWLVGGEPLEGGGGGPGRDDAWRTGRSRTGLVRWLASPEDLDGAADTTEDSR